MENKQETYNMIISEELLEMLQEERKRFVKEIRMDFSLEQTIWEMKKILNGVRENGKRKN